MTINICKSGKKALSWRFHLNKLFFPASLCLLLIVLCAWRGQGQSLVLTLADNGKKVTVSPGYQISVQLPDNSGSTGYSWQNTTLKNQVLTLRSTRYIPPGGPPMPGASGTIMFTFTAQRNGSTVLRLELRRPWETGQAPAQRFEATVQVRS